MAQVKFVVNEELLRKFKQIVLAKHGKIELTPEGEEALRLYISKYGSLIEGRHRGGGSLAKVIGAVTSGGTRNALRDLKELESGGS